MAEDLRTFIARNALARVPSSAGSPLGYLKRRQVSHGNAQRTLAGNAAISVDTLAAVAAALGCTAADLVRDPDAGRREPDLSGTQESAAIYGPASDDSTLEQLADLIARIPAANRRAAAAELAEWVKSGEGSPAAILALLEGAARRRGK